MATAEPSRSAAAPVDKSELARPLALPSPTVHPDPESHDAEAAEETSTATATRWRSAQYLRKRRCVLCCGGCCVTTVVVIGVLILVLALTVFKIKDPRLNINKVWLTDISVATGSGVANPVSFNATLLADLSIKNPNAAAMKFAQSETDVSYKGQTVSVAYAPAGSVGADRTTRLNVTLDLLGDQLARAANSTGLLFGQEYDIDTYTALSGRVKVLGIVKKHVDIRLNCTIIIAFGGAAAALASAQTSAVEIKGVNCVAHVSL
jgi:hypothetical protein